MIKEGSKVALKNKIDLYISTDEEEALNDHNRNLDQLYRTEKLEEVDEVKSSQISSYSNGNSESQSRSEHENGTIGSENKKGMKVESEK